MADERARFQVRLVHGHLTAQAGRYSRPEQLSAQVLDRVFAWRCVRIFRSEAEFGEHAPGVEAAIRAAEEYAAELNASA